MYHLYMQNGKCKVITYKIIEMIGWMWGDAVFTERLQPGIYSFTINIVLSRLYHCRPLFARANTNMAQLQKWFIANRLSLNLDKTCYSIFGHCREHLSAFKLYIDGKIIKKVECCKYLGILIDSDLTWQEHINYIYNKLVKFTSIFYKIRTKLPQAILQMIYFAFIHSHILYGIEVYGNTSANHLRKLKVLNNKLLRILQHKPIRTHNCELYRTYITHFQ